MYKELKLLWLHYENRHYDLDILFSSKLFYIIYKNWLKLLFYAKSKYVQKLPYISLKIK